MKTTLAMLIALVTLTVAPGCEHEERGPMLAGGHEVKWWVAALRDAKPRVRREAVLKLGNVGDADPAAAEGLAGALRDADPLVRREAVLAVVKLRQPGDAIRAQLEIMNRSDRDPKVRDAAQRALKRLEPGP